MAADTVALVEAAYQLEPDDAAWIQNIARAVQPLLDDHQGLVASFYDTRHPSGLKLGPLAGLRTPAATQEEADRLSALVPRSQLPRLYPPVAFTGWLTQVFSNKSTDTRALRKLAAPFGQVLGVTCPSGPGRGVVLSIFSTEPRTEKVSRAAWLQLATHLSHAARLRATLGTRDVSLNVGPNDAVLTGSGHLVHAGGAARALDARQALRDAARAVDRARSGGRREDPEGALFSWKGLVEGRWSLVDQFDSDGRRFLVARRNDPAFRRPRALSSRERHVAALAAVGHSSKVIAYQLGITSAAVTATLTRALQKLGLESRSELARVAGVIDPWGGAVAPPAGERQ